MLGKPLHTRCGAFAIASAFFLVACGGDETPAPAAETAKSQAESTPAPAKKMPEPSKSPSPPTKAPSNVTVEKRDSEGNAIEFSGTDGQGNEFQASIGEEAEVPGSFPSDVPIFSGATPMATMTAAGEGSMVTFKSEKSQQEIYSFYETQLEEQGWTIDNKEGFGGQLGLGASKENRKVTISISGTSGDSRFSVIVMDGS